MQVCSVNFRRYINSVIATIALEVRIGEGIADLEAVFPFTTVERRLDSRTRKADRIVVLVAVQGNAGQPVRVELEAVRTQTTSRVEPTPTPGTLELAKKVSFPSLPSREELEY